MYSGKNREPSWLMTIHLSTGTKLYARGNSDVHIENMFSSLYQRWLNALTRETYSYTKGSRVFREDIPRVPKNATLRGNKFTFDHEGDLPTGRDWSVELIMLERV